MLIGYEAAWAKQMKRLAMQIGAAVLSSARQGYFFRRQLQEFRSLYEGDLLSFDKWRQGRLEKIELLAEKAAYYNGAEFQSVRRVDKSAVRSEPELFRVKKGFWPSVVRTQTSGTTGVGLTLYADQAAIATQAASWWLFRSFFGVEPGDRGMVVGGRRIPRGSGCVGDWIFLPGLNQVYVSSFNMSADAIDEYLVAMEHYGVRWIHGYPSALLVIADHILQNKVRLNFDLRLVSTGSETISVAGREALKAAFQCEVSEFYGQVENVCAMWRCPRGTLHDLGVIGDLVLDQREDNESFEIVGTGYWNSVMPLLGYRTGDLLTQRVEYCGCGFPYPLGLEIEGRVDDYILTSKGAKVGRLARIFTHVQGCGEAQLVQTGVKNFVLKLGRGGVVDESEFRRDLESMLAEEVEFAVVHQDQFVRTKGGKVKSVVREI